MAQEVGEALGAQAGEARLSAAMRDASFAHVRRAATGPFNMVLEALMIGACLAAADHERPRRSHSSRTARDTVAGETRAIDFTTSSMFDVQRDDAIGAYPTRDWKLPGHQVLSRDRDSEGVSGT
jgi:hypothetical protein